MTLDSIPHPAPLGEKVVGFHRSTNPTDDDLVSLLKTVFAHGVVVVPDQSIAVLAALAGRIGDSEVVLPVEHRLPGSTTLRLQTNVPGLGVAGGGTYWHADGSWLPASMDLTLLHCVVAPNSGGTTTFVDAAALYDAFSPADRAELDIRIGEFPNRKILHEDLLGMGIDSPEMLARTVDATHPLVRNHPHTNRRALILNGQWLRGIVGMDQDAAAAYLAGLYARVEAFSGRYTHTWHDGDLLIWDNHRVLHRAAPVAEYQRKITVRARIPHIAPHLLVAG